MERKIFLLAGLGLGDESKGATVDWLQTVYPVGSIWRYNGGAQAAHHVVSEQGKVHCFSQLGSGLLSGPVTTCLSRFMVVNPIALMGEYEELETKIEHHIPEICLDSQALIITPYHTLINQIREISRGEKRLGSCGRGVGETMKDAKKYPQEIIRVKDLSNPAVLKYKLRFWQTLKTDAAEQIFDSYPADDALPARLVMNLQKMRSEEYFQALLYGYKVFSKQTAFRVTDDLNPLSLLINPNTDIVFEGAQGVLLDRDRGFYPHVTQSDTSFRNAEELILEQNLSGEIVKLGILRAYSTRHGVGPFVTYDSELTELIPDQNNIENEWQGDFRIGWLDLVATRYALKVLGKINGIALTNLDRFEGLSEVKTCSVYEYDGLYSREKIEKFFDLELEDSNQQNLKPIITGIKLLSTEQLVDYDARQTVTNILNDCRPIYQIHLVDPKKFVQDYIQFLEQNLKVKVLLSSAGPKASNKTLLASLSK